MAKTLTAGVIAQKDAAQHKARVLVEIALDALTLRYVADKGNLVFPYSGGDTFTAKNLTISGASQDAEGQIGRITVKLDNVGADMAGIVAAYPVRKRTLTIRRVYLDADNHAPASADDYVEVFSGRIDDIKAIDREWLQITATVGEPLQGRPLNVYYGRLCNRVFGDARCNASGYADLTTLKATGTADSGTTTTLVDSALTQAEDFWNHGLITITQDGLTYNRIVEDFNATTDTITLDMALPFSIGATTTYVVYKGCDKTAATCADGFAFGPSSDNSANFGGFVHARSGD